MGNLYVKSWVCVLLVVAFIRLQVFCSCGVIDHCCAQAQAELCSVQLQSPQDCAPPSHVGCECKHHSAKSSASSIRSEVASAEPQFSAAGSISSKTDCNCHLCKRCLHLPHLYASQPWRVSLQDIGADGWACKAAVRSSEWSLKSRADLIAANANTCGENGLSILCRLGRLLI